MSYILCRVYGPFFKKSIKSISSSSSPPTADLELTDVWLFGPALCPRLGPLEIGCELKLLLLQEYDVFFPSKRMGSEVGSMLETCLDFDDLPIEIILFL